MESRGQKGPPRVSLGKPGIKPLDHGHGWNEGAVAIREATPTSPSKFWRTTPPPLPKLSPEDLRLALFYAHTCTFYR